MHFIYLHFYLGIVNFYNCSSRNRFLSRTTKNTKIYYSTPETIRRAFHNIYLSESLVWVTQGFLYHWPQNLFYASKNNPNFLHVWTSVPPLLFRGSGEASCGEDLGVFVAQTESIGNKINRGRYVETCHRPLIIWINYLLVLEKCFMTLWWRCWRKTKIST